MKNIKNFLVAVLALVMLPTVVFAQDTATETELTDCIAEEGSVCKLTSDVELTNIIHVTNNTTIDLNGHSIKPNSTLTFTGGLLRVAYGAELVINDSVGTGLISAGTTDKIYAGIQVAYGDVVGTESAKLTVNGGTIEGYYYGIVGNGTRHNTDITINGGTIKGLNTNDCYGIYNPQNGKLTVNGGTIEGATGIEIRAGELVVNGGTIIGNGSPVSVTSNGNGTTTVGAGIAIAQHTTKLDLSVKVNGGKIEGFTALYESNPENNDETSLDKINIAIKGGTFNAINNGTNAVSSDDDKLTITGGSFSNDVEMELEDGYTTAEIDGVFTVGKINNITAVETENGAVASDKETAIKGETITLTVTPEDGYEIKDIKVVDATGRYVTVNDNKFIMPDSNVLVFAEFKAKEVTVDPETPVVPVEPETPVTPTEPEVENPNTIDAIDTYVAIAAASVLALSSIVVFKKKLCK